MMSSKSDFALRIRSFSWISHLSDVRGDPSGDHASASIFGCGSYGIDGKADRS
jgi:hypothetical protein